MEPQTSFLDLFIFGAFFAVGIGVYHNLLRRIQESSGKVRTAELDIPDLLVTIVLAGFFAMLTLQTFSQPESAEAVPLKPEQVLPGAIFFPIMVIGIAAFLRFRGVSLKHLFGFDRLSTGRALVLAIGLILAAIPLVRAAGLLIQPFMHETAREQELVTLFRNVSRKSDYLSVGQIMFAGVVLAPLSEEFLFRGYFYGALKRYCGAVPSAVFTSALFAASHMNLSSLPSLFALALCLTIAYGAAGSLLVPIAMHALFNLSQLLSLYYQSSHGG